MSKAFKICSNFFSVSWLFALKAETKGFRFCLGASVTRDEE